MKASKTLIDHIRKVESCKLRAYQDSVGVWTIGYGHTKGVKKGDVISKQLAEEFLQQDLAQFEAIVSKYKNLNTQGRFDAVLDFCYNCGVANYNSSTLKKYIDTGHKDWEIQEQFLRWVYANKQKLGGLVTRRIWEANRFVE